MQSSSLEIFFSHLCLHPCACLVLVLLFYFLVSVFTIGEPSTGFAKVNVSEQVKRGNCEFSSYPVQRLLCTHSTKYMQY